MGASALAAALIVGGIVALRNTVTVSDPAPGALRYALCQSNVGSVSVIPTPGGVAPFGIAVQLERAATDEFERVTGEAPGQMLEVVFADRLFARARIERGIRSGTIVSQAFASAEEADGAARQLRQQLSAQPCGRL